MLIQTELLHPPSPGARRAAHSDDANHSVVISSYIFMDPSTLALGDSTIKTATTHEPHRGSRTVQPRSRIIILHTISPFTLEQ